MRRADLMYGDHLQQQYKGYTICGSAESVHNDSGLYFAHASVLLIRPDNTCVVADSYQDQLFIFADEPLAQQVGLFLAELAVDHFVPPPAYFLTPMNIGWAVDILRRAADECKTREIRRPKLYEALDFLEQERSSLNGSLNVIGANCRAIGATNGKRTNFVKRYELRRAGFNKHAPRCS